MDFPEIFKVLSSDVLIKLGLHNFPLTSRLPSAALKDPLLISVCGHKHRSAAVLKCKYSDKALCLFYICTFYIFHSLSIFSLFGLFSELLPESECTVDFLTYLQLFILILTARHANDEQLITNERRVNNEHSIK